jgi:glucosamine--fructose-6-phosphate aminotransferase (isomerizing)
MCGIIGYVGREKKAKDVVLSGLKNLEYRGYDSSGIAIIKENAIDIQKSIGKIVNLENKLKNMDMNFDSNIAIGHTRWATHGIPNELNAHPHKVGNVTLVHNGIIENYNILKEFLKKEGVIFNSDTDTEVACAYINYVYKSEKNKLKCIDKACKEFRGSYAFLIIFDDELDTVYAARKDSPLIIGISTDSNYIASDMSAILDFTKEYIILEHGEIAKVTKDDIKIYNSDEKEIKKEINIASWDSLTYKKNGFEHFMLKEIHEQPKVVNNIFTKYINDDIKMNIDFNKFTNIHIVGCGSAMHAGLIGKYLFENNVYIPVTVEVASEYRYKNQLINDNTLVIVISQSGETADTIAALKIAKQKGAFVLGVVNTFGSTIARECDLTLYTYAGPEIAVATTKGYTTQVCVLTTLVLEAMKQKNLLEDSLKEKIYEEFKNISTILNDIISRNLEFKNVASKIYDKNDAFLIGRGIDFAICMEGSLKLKEISYIHSEAYPAGELKHGTISLIEEGIPVIAIATDELLYEKTISNALETKARGSFIIFISNNKLDNSSFADINITVPKTTEFTQSLIVGIVLQLIAYETAKFRDCDIDKPRNLAKSVTVE